MKRTSANAILKKKMVIIGALHFAPLPGYSGHPGMAACRRLAEQDMKAFVNGGVDAVIIENNYDLPHRATVGPETVAAMTALGSHLRTMTALPLGVSVLWNDYRAALAIAQAIGATFIRVPVFVDRVRTAYGIIDGEPRSIVAYRKKIGAPQVAILADIHVKHATILSRSSLKQSAKRAVQYGADGLIVTGRWTGEAPNMNELRSLRGVVRHTPIFAGSGATSLNVSSILDIADGCIVSTSLKSGKNNTHRVNIKGWQQRVHAGLVRNFVAAATLP